MDYKSSIEFLTSLQDKPHPLHNMQSITFLPLSGWEEDVKRKGTLSEIIRRLTRLEEDVRKLKSKV